MKIELDRYAQEVLNRELTPSGTHTINKAMALFNDFSDRLYTKYKEDITLKRISETNQIKIAEDYIKEHGHACKDYKRSFLLKAYHHVTFNEPFAEIRIGTFIKVYYRCHAHRRILDEYSVKISQHELLMKFEREYQTKESEFARFLCRLDPTLTFSGWRKKIQNFRKQKLLEAKNGTMLQ